jgi:SAM-dependent methyltransferase
MNQYTKTNLLRWNEVTSIHQNSEFYDVEGFKAGKSTLKSIELNELGDVTGKSILHLQCHFGLDSLSLSRLGAKVTGIDLSDKAIQLAKELNKDTGLDARFICSDIYELTEVLDEKYDIVFTSYGVLCWLSNLEKWAQIINHYLKPGGTFFMVDGHPLSNILEYDSQRQEFKVRDSYFNEGPIPCESETSYGDNSEKVECTQTYQWDHSVSEIVNSLIKAGINIKKVNEYPYSVYEKFKGIMEKDSDGWWKIKSEPKIPLLFSVLASKTKSILSK